MTTQRARRARPASNTLSQPVRLKTSGPADLLELVPYLLGFQPTDSVVLVVIRDRQVALAARVDLPPPAVSSELVQRFLEIAEANDASGLVLFAFSPDRPAVREVLQQLIGGLADFGVVDAIHADGSRWWSLVCAGSCCPTEGTPYDPGSGRLAAEAVYAGLSACSSRAEIEASVSGPAATDAPHLQDVVERVTAELNGCTRRQRRSEAAAFVESFLIDPCSLADAERARLALLVADLEVRDVAWSLMSRTRAADHVDLWQQVVSRTMSPLACAPLCLLGMAAWISGNGALMVCCLERVTALDPGYTMGALLADINRRGLPPTAWDSLVESMRAKVGPMAG